MTTPEEENFYAFRGRWLDYLATRRDLTHADFRVAYFIASKINPADECMWWGVKRIALELSVSISTVTGAIRRLDQKGLITIVKGKKGLHRYFMRMPIDPAESASRAMPELRKKTGGRKPRVSKTKTK